MELRDLEIETPGEEMPKHRRVDESALYPQRRSLILKAAGALLLIILLIVLFSAGGDKGASDELDAVQSRVSRLEQQLARIEVVGQNRITELEAVVSSLQVLTKDMKDRMEESKKSAPPTPQVRSAAPQKNPTEKRFHVVRGGETLFSIAKKYGTSSDELRRDNHISRNIIQPGQRLIVNPGI